MSDDKRKSCSVWLNPRHVLMLEQMGLTIGEATRKAIEEAFEARNDREFARILIEEDLSDLAADWNRKVGLTTSAHITSTEDGFRVVLVALKDFND